MYRKPKQTDEDIARLHIKSKDTLELETALNFIQDLKAWRREQKLYSTYIKGIEKAVTNTNNSRVFFDYRLEGTVTGRLSCGAYRASKDGKALPLGVSFHTLPRDKSGETSIRQAFIAEPDEIFITADFKAMELRVLAHIANETNMIKAFHSGEDLHKYTASLIYEKPISEVTKEERQTAKSVSFLVVYGGGAWKLSKTANIPLPLAESIIERLKEVYPRVFEWMEEVKQELCINKYVTSLFGRRRHLPDIDSPIQKIKDRCIRQAVNYKIQSSASDIVCFAVIDTYNELHARALSARLLGSVHDSIEVTSSRDELEEVLQVMYQKMTNYPLLKSLGYHFKVPIEVEFDIGRSFSGGTEVKFNKTGSVLNREILQG